MNKSKFDRDDFFDEIIAVCKKYGVSISHEDGHGAFIVEVENEYNFDWLKDAIIELEGE